MKKTLITGLSTLLFAVFFTTAAFARELMVGGEAVGIQIHTKGVLVAELAEVETMDGPVSPAKEAGLQKGDLITAIDGEAVGSAVALVEAVGQREGEPVALTVQREEETLSIRVQPVQSAEKQWMLGTWLRDGINGVGTLTYVDPQTRHFGALGHAISDGETGRLIPMDSGCIRDAEIVGVTPGQSGQPGELQGCADMGKVLGNVEKNTVFGIFGRLDAPLGGEIVETGEPVLGRACILSTVRGRDCREYQVEITRVCRDGAESHLVLQITDPELLSCTGGIVQGMSGSPIIQDGKLVGAVTHVLVNDPTRGYGIFIENMLDAAG